MILANKNRSQAYIDEGKKFATETKAPFSDAKRIAMLAIAEYLANKDGFTVYESVATKTETED